MIKICVAGGRGTMGRLICGEVSQSADARLRGILEAPGHRDGGSEFFGATVLTDPLEAAEEADVIIDFSVPQATMKLLPAALEKKTALVIGTTGFSKEDREKITKTAGDIPLLLAPNMSVGVNLLFKAAKMINDSLTGMDYDREIVEAHHRRKADAPSGTAGELVKIISNPGDKAVYGRKGASGGRQQEEVGVHAVRGGGIIGEHTLMWIGQEDRIELTHRASSRKVFAAGALKAALWLSGREKGKLYGMGDVLK